jgi:hypothetical protein
MTNTYALTDYDVYQDEDYDNFGGRRRRRRKKRRTRKLLKRRRSSKPKLSRPPVRSRPRVVRGRPIKLPPIRVKTIPVIRKKTVQPKKAVVKTKKPPVKTKTPIGHLIRKSNPAVVKTPLSAIAKAEVKQLQTAQIEASKKGMKPESKVGNIVKVIAIIGVAGTVGFGIYKFIKNKKLSNSTHQIISS